MEKIHLSRLEPGLAAAMLAGCEHLDPAGISTAADLTRMTQRGECFAATDNHGGQAVYVVHVVNGVAWVDACKGAGGTDWSAALLPIIEAQSTGCKAVAFQTKRPGLVRKAKRQGYTVAGWILKKEMK